MCDTLKSNLRILLRRINKTLFRSSWNLFSLSLSSFIHSFKQLHQTHLLWLFSMAIYLLSTKKSFRSYEIKNRLKIINCRIIIFLFRLFIWISISTLKFILTQIKWRKLSCNMILFLINKIKMSGFHLIAICLHSNEYTEVCLRWNENIEEKIESKF